MEEAALDGAFEEEAVSDCASTLGELEYEVDFSLVGEQIVKAEVSDALHQECSEDVGERINYLKAVFPDLLSGLECPRNFRNTFLLPYLFSNLIKDNDWDLAQIRAQK